MAALCAVLLTACAGSDGAEAKSLDDGPRVSGPSGGPGRSEWAGPRVLVTLWRRVVGLPRGSVVLAGGGETHLQRHRAYGPHGP